jgi:hypothetical protein
MTINTDLTIEDFSTLEELVKFKEQIKKTHSKEILQTLFDIISSDPLIKLVSKHNYDEIEKSPANFNFLLNYKDVVKFYKNNNEKLDCQKLKKKYIQEKIIDKFNIWLYEFIKKDKDIDKILTELREKYTDYNIPNFVIPTLFSLNVANDEKNNSCFLSYKFI